MLSKHRIVVVTPTLMLLITLDTLSTRKWKSLWKMLFFSVSRKRGRRVGKTRLQPETSRVTQKPIYCLVTNGLFAAKAR